MLALKDNCIHPETKQPYIKTGQGGKDNSPEGKQVGHFPSTAQWMRGDIGSLQLS